MITSEKSIANQALLDLHHGRIKGRAVLIP